GYVSFDPANAQPDSFNNTYSTKGDYTGQVYVPGVSGFDKVFDAGVTAAIGAAFAYVGAGAAGLIDAPAATTAADSVASGGGTDIFGGNGMATGFTDTGTAG